MFENNCFFVTFCLAVVASQDPLIEVSQGILRGIALTNRDGGTFYGFRSIPYAQPPINQLRFKAPLPAEGWDGIRDATTEIPSCTQSIITQHPSTFGKEDCLYLNVFIPTLPAEDAHKKPVMVFIHGGGFTSGAATSSLYGPEFLMTKDIVLVTINYRVGIFGFLNLNDPALGVPGNAAMKDQVLALKWVKQNIRRFGGDENNILIFGDSGGSISVHLHILSPMSAGLFNKVIGQSGTGLMPTILSAENTGVLVAEQLGIPTANMTEMLQSLRSVSAEDLCTAQQIIMESGDIFFTAPNVEQPSDEPGFLLDRPIDVLLSGSYNHVPLLTGINNFEGTAYTDIMSRITGQNILIEDFTELMPEDLEIVPGSEEEALVVAKIKQFYYGNTEPSREDILPAVELYSDFLFGFPAYRAAREHALTGSDPVYVYYFTADTSLNFLKQTNVELQQFPGAVHGDERGYLFQTAYTPLNIEAGSVEDLAIRNVVDLWTNFAIYGDPTPVNSKRFVWKPITEETFNFLWIGTNYTHADVNLRAENMAFWSAIYDEHFPRK